MIKKIKRFLMRLNNAASKDYSRLCKNEIYRAMFEVMSHNNSFKGVSEDFNGEQIIVSLTTYGERIYSVHRTIESLMQQTMKAARIILWLSEDEYDDQNLPIVLKKMQERGLEIKYCPDYKSYKKLIPTLQLDKESIIITVDDDMIYPAYMIENMYRTHSKYPDSIVFNYGCELAVDSEHKILPYDTWCDRGDFSTPSLMYMGIGVGGILYPPKALHSDVVCVEEFQNLAPKADDLWFKIMAYRLGTKYVQTCFGKKILSSEDFLSEYITIEDEQKERLGTENVINKANDYQMKALIERYSIKF
mgnify:CR=1 FL=1